MAERILVVDPDERARAEMAAALRPQYEIAEARDIESAVGQLNAASVDLLITVVRLGLFNGLPLVLRSAGDHPRMAAIVVHESRGDSDPYTQTPRPPGAPLHLSRPLDPSDLLHRVADALAGRERRRWSRTVLQAPLTIHTVSGRARVLDVSYGGMRLEFPSAPQGALPGRFHLELSSVGVQADARRVWSQPRGGAMRCGTELQATTSKRALRWRRLVDSLRRAGAPGPASNHED